jgi:hypothetical protein
MSNHNMEKLTYDPPVALLNYKVCRLDKLSQGTRCLAAAAIRAAASKKKYKEKSVQCVTAVRLREVSWRGEATALCRMPFGELRRALAVLRGPAGELWKSAWLEYAEPHMGTALVCRAAPLMFRMCREEESKKLPFALLDLMYVGTGAAANAYGRLASAAASGLPAETFVAAGELPHLLGMDGQPPELLKAAFSEAIEKIQSAARFWFIPKAQAAYNEDCSLRGFECALKSALAIWGG